MSYLVFVLSTFVVYVALATLLHLQFGRTGIVNFGIIGFFGFGMYGQGILIVQYEVPYLIALLIATAATGLLGLVLGAIVLDLKSESVLVGTLAFATILGHLVTTESWLTEGVQGLGTVPYPFDFGDQTASAFFGLLIVITGVIIAYAFRVQAVPYGRLLTSIKDNESLARGLGKTTYRQKLVFFAITCGLMGMLGAFQASIEQFLVPRMMGPGLTFTIWIALVLGGRSRVLGGLVGAILTVGIFDVWFDAYAPLPRDLSEMMPNIKFMTYGLILVLVIMFRNNGLLGERRSG